MKINILSAVKNLTKNLLLLFSTGAALSLLLPPSKTISLALIGLIFIAVCVAAIYDVAKPQKTQNQYAVTTIFCILETFLLPTIIKSCICPT